MESGISQEKRRASQPKKDKKTERHRKERHRKERNRKEREIGKRGRSEREGERKAARGVSPVVDNVAQ
eukprot:1269595-Amorphochlora_amoeboformis.AAC.1